MRMCEFSLVAGPGAPGAIRRAVDAVPELTCDMRADVRLLLSALATAPLLVPEGCGLVTLRIRVTGRPDGVRAQIEATSETPPPARPAGEHPRRRHRLPLLERVCSRWGMVRTGEVGAVWFELDERSDPGLWSLAPVALSP